MSWHPAVGDFRAQLPRITLIVAMLVAAAILIGLHQQRASLPSERWYRLSQQQVVEADLSWRVADAMELLRQQAAFVDAETVRQMRERAVGVWERRALAGQTNHAAAYRLGVVYGHRGYAEQSSDMLALAAQLDESDSDYYHALSEIYSNPELSDEALGEKAELVAQRDGWIARIVLADVYQRLGAAEQLAEVRAEQETHATRFALGMASVTLIGGLLLLTGIIALATALWRWGFTVRERSAPLPFLVPWTVVDITEAVAVLLFAMVVGGMLTSMAFADILRVETWPLGRPLLMALQYVLVSGVTIGVLLYRARARASNPLRVLGVRLRGALKLVGTGVVGYSVFLTLLVVLALVAGSMFGGMALGQTTEEVIGSAETPGEIAIYFVLVAVLAPIFEELIFRGYVYGGLRRIFTPRQAMLLGGAVFAAVHLNAEAFLIITLIGIMLCYLYERTRSLLPAIIAHGIHNALVLGVMLLQST
ncbi:MAG: CPBP family intramembrane metalloprotease [candidate division WS1 bacterium]|nr:CPBP family intramembrane metalloprotease [candidate division WS1 bacterium]